MKANVAKALKQSFNNNTRYTTSSFIWNNSNTSQGVYKYQSAVIYLFVYIWNHTFRFTNHKMFSFGEFCLFCLVMVISSIMKLSFIIYAISTPYQMRSLKSVRIHSLNNLIHIEEIWYSTSSRFVNIQYVFWSLQYISNIPGINFGKSMRWFIIG